MATKLPKGKEKIVQEAGATRRRTLSVVLAAMESNLTKSELASRMKLTERTIERILEARFGYCPRSCSNTKRVFCASRPRRRPR